MDNKRLGFTGFLEIVIGILMDFLPFVCAAFIVLWAGKAYTEGYGLFVEQARDKPGEAHTEMVTITEEDAASSLAVGRLLEKQELIGSGVFFALRTKLSGAEGMIRPGTYILSSDMSPEKILTSICTDPAVENTGQEEAAMEEKKTTGGVQKENRDVWGQ